MAINSYGNLTNEQKTFYDRTLLERLIPKLVFMQHGQKRTIPKREGATVDYRRFNRLDPATTPLTEGVTPTGKALDIANVTATVQGYGDYVTLTDFIDMAGIDPVITETIEVLGEQAAESLDIVVRDEIAKGTNAYYVTADGVGTARDDVAGKLTGGVMRRIRQIMARNNVKPVPGTGGAYLAFVHPDVSYDIMEDNAAWTNANQYAGSTKIFNGELGKMYGIRFIETTMAPIYEGEGAGDAGLEADVYASIVIGANAYGVPDIAGSSKPKTIVKPLGSAGTGDPLEQRSSVGWKAYLAAVRLDELCILRVETIASVGALS